MADVWAEPRPPSMVAGVGHPGQLGCSEILLFPKKEESRGILPEAGT